MLRSTAGKVMWIGRATVFLVGLAMILALVFGAASAAFGANGKPFILGKRNVASAITTLVKQGPGPALSLAVRSGQPPMRVNSTGLVRNLNADRLDGKDSVEILPFIRAQRDANPGVARTQTGESATMNAVSIAAPTGGFFVISGSATVSQAASSGNGVFSITTKLDGGEATRALVVSEAGYGESVSPHVTVPVGKGPHTVTFVADRIGGSGNWAFDANNLTVEFVPKGRGAVTETSVGG